MKTLEQLREENCGYNPEEVSIDDIDEWSGVTITANGISYNNTFLKCEKEYIETYPRRYGIIFSGFFYIEEL